LRNPDGYLESNKNNLISVLDLIRSKKPNVVYLPHSEEGHPDHRKTNGIVLTAVGRASGPWFQESQFAPWKVSIVLAYEVHPPLREANYCEDVSEFADLKVEALREHKSQLEDISYDLASDAMTHYRGILTSGYKRSECFHLVQVERIFFDKFDK